MNGTDLLADFRESRSEGAFSELVRRYTNLVYSIAKRRLTNTAQAEEVTQTVFIRLAKAVPKLRGDAELVAWLHRTTMHVSIDLWRSESRRRAREEHAATMQQPELVEDVSWNELAPVLDEALNELNDADRHAILLRYFDDKTMRDLGAIFGVSEDAAKMRLSRAMDRLRNRLSGHGVACGAVALGAMLEQRSVEAAPTHLAAILASLKFSTAPGAGVAVGLFGLGANVFRAKLAVGIAALLIAGAAILFFVRFQGVANNSVLVDAGQIAESNAARNDAASASARPETNYNLEDKPNPIKLLQAIAQARQQIVSGEIEFEAAHYEFDRPLDGTNHIQIKAIFDGDKQRFESSDREYAYMLRGDNAAEITDAKQRELGLDREAAVAAGLLKGFESRHVKMYDGAILMDYWTHDGKRFRTDIKDPADGSGYYLFDPRILGISRTFSQGETVMSCLVVENPASVKLIGSESLDGTEAWHVRIETKSHFKSDFWIDTRYPLHIIKLVSNGDSMVSRFDASHPEDVLPIEVTSLDFNGRKVPRSEIRLIRRKTQFNIPVDPSLWTLAGLNMQIGTDVVDCRISRSIGYWTGTGLSEDLPTKTASTKKSAPNLAEMLTLLENDPASASALEAATWILLNTPDRPDVEKASEVILREHIQNPDLANLAQELGRVRPRSAVKLLETMIDNNPNVEVRAIACFTLAIMRNDEADYGVNKKAASEAEKLFERVVTEFSGTSPKGTELARQAKPHLYELRHMTIGKPAPEIDAEALDGGKIKLSDYRGKIVVLAFWSRSYSEVPDHRKLLEHAAGKPFALISINCDKDTTTAKSLVEKFEISWPTIWDGRSGPISTTWNINSWTSVIVLDRKGIIRYRGARERNLIDAVDALLRE